MFLLATLFLFLFIAATLAFIVAVYFYQKQKEETEYYKQKNLDMTDMYFKLHNKFYEADYEKDKFGFWKMGYKLREKPLDNEC